MALLEKHRNEIYNYFVTRLGEEATQAMLSQFPARDVETPVTKADLAITRGDLRTEVQSVRTEIQSVRTEIQSVRTEVESVRTEVESVRTEIAKQGTRTLRHMLAIAAIGLTAMALMLNAFT